MTTITIVAMVADSATITLYLDDGTDMVLKSNEYRTQEIVDKIMPFISNHKKAKIDIEDYQVYNQFEKKTGGLVRFFRIAKTAVASIFGPDPDEEPKQPAFKPHEIKNIPEAPAPVRLPMTAAQIEATGSRNIPVNLQETDTIVAVVGTGPKARAIPHMEKLESQFKNSITGSEKGMVRFLERIAAVVEKRGHSVQDLLKFLEKGDLPIADDGSVIAYKLLRKIDGETYVDCHTQKVKQYIGSHVFMDPNKVDPSRSKDCSHGLHIARRDYLGSFSGDVVVLCKIAPEDFIAVPQYSPSKVRVCGYHILFELPAEVKAILMSNKPMTTNDVAAKMLGAAMSGDHIGIVQTVEIKGESGTNVITTLINPDLKVKPTSQMTGTMAKALSTEKEQAAPSEGMSPKELHQKAEDERAKVAEQKANKAKADKEITKIRKETGIVSPADGPLSKADQFKALYFQWTKTGRPVDFQALQDMKKKAKKGYAALGLESHQIYAVEKHLKTLN